MFKKKQEWNGKGTKWGKKIPQILPKFVDLLEVVFASFKEDLMPITGNGNNFVNHI